MLYVVEIRRDREQLAAIISDIRQWLDGQRFEPDAFRCTTDEENVTCRLEFKIESEAVACAEAFRGRVTSMRDKTVG
jgi:hypothetical protein